MTAVTNIFLKCKINKNELPKILIKSFGTLFISKKLKEPYCLQM